MNTPISKKNRIEQMDVIRGFALFGVLLVNLTMIDATMYTYSSSFNDTSGVFNQISAWMIHIFASGKFYTLFSILFGLGFYFFMNKNDGTFVENKLFARRLIALFFFGLLHVVFVWYGDILHVYAVTGAILLANRNKSPEKLLKTGIILFLLSTAIFVLASSMNGSQETFNPIVDEATIAYTQTSYLEMVVYRMTNEIPNLVLNLVFVIPKILSLFLFGYYIGKREIFKNLDENQLLIHRVWIRSLIVSVLCIIGYTLYDSPLIDANMQFISVLFDEVLTLSGALFYATTLIKIYKNDGGKRLLTPLRYSGQMALTNYLTQTIFFTTLINGYGFGLFGKIPQAGYFPIALSFYMLQCLFSVWWMNRYRFGPMEKVWRIFTYGQNRKAV